MSRNLLLLGDVLSDEEHVLGCMCDSFRSCARPQERKQLIQYRRSVPMNRIEWKNPVYNLKLKKKDLSYPSIVVSNLWFALVPNPIIFVFNLRWERIPIGSKRYPYPLSRKSYLKKDYSLILDSCKNGLTGSATQQTFIIKYRYCIGGSHCERPIIG